MEWLRTQHKDEKPTVSLRDLLKFKYEGGTIQEHSSRFLDALHVVENVSKPPQPQTMAMVSEIYLGSLPTKFSRHVEAENRPPSFDLKCANDAQEPERKKMLDSCVKYARDQNISRPPRDFPPSWPRTRTHGP